jgi:hypothetical protein
MNIRSDLDSNKVKGVGYGENNIRDGKFTTAWVSIINFFPAYQGSAWAPNNLPMPKAEETFGILIP